ncbi:hypothetical protein FHX82_007364 [Amycolatopsis bartoniae]|uniref:Membrane protein n=1 Tax=Amycolatopsis bartoniae TaxID=941986 RepID=A0A8H9MDM8_9PSEU|nr:DUF2975 domain-containing protein [Amycolatopsis bartoniae]MBB2940277.1 hypothetical protein [Amycolatopsis bartoniae]TVT09469.1 DUF2975 domain-containing protein [Amycolatopsis bartoniae]GHF53566.1 membrane protein [Amycolatopsis bartoniae]
MISEKWAVRALRVFLVVLFGVLVVFQTLSLPGGIAYHAQQNPHDANLRWPLTAIAVFLVLCVQVVLVATWQLLTLVQKDRIFTTASLKWVDLIVWAIAAAWLVFAGMLLFVGLNADDPGMPMVLFLVTVGITVLGLLMVVLRALLRQATVLRSDMEAVI